jgi:hypothetical protein
MNRGSVQEQREAASEANFLIDACRLEMTVSPAPAMKVPFLIDA